MKVLNVLVLSTCFFCSNYIVLADNTSGSTAGSKHIKLPFVDIQINRHDDGTNDVHVKAPFTNVNNPAGPNNAEVKAPFTHVHNTATNTEVKAPFTRVSNPVGPNNAQVNGPVTKVESKKSSSQSHST